MCLVVLGKDGRDLCVWLCLVTMGEICVSGINGHVCVWSGWLSMCLIVTSWMCVLGTDVHLCVKL